MPVLSPERESVATSMRAHEWVSGPRVSRRGGRGLLGGAARVVAVIVAVLLGWVGIHHLGDLLPGATTRKAPPRIPRLARDTRGPDTHSLARMDAPTDSRSGDRTGMASSFPTRRDLHRRQCLIDSDRPGTDPVTGREPG